MYVILHTNHKGDRAIGEIVFLSLASRTSRWDTQDAFKLTDMHDVAVCSYGRLGMLLRKFGD